MIEMRSLPLIERAASHGNRVALRTATSEHSYAELLAGSTSMSSYLLGAVDDLNQQRVAFLLPAGSDYVTVQWGIWQAGGVAVPLSLSATDAELEYTLRDASPVCVVTDREHAGRIAALCQRMNLQPVTVDKHVGATPKPMPKVDPGRRAMMLYTSGTTSQPKGVVTTHANIRAQIETLVEAWHWQSCDCIPLFLPLHHVHGIINVMSCALWSGATIEPFAHFDLPAILPRVAAHRYTVFMAVPTIYVKMIQSLRETSSAELAPILEGFRRMRLMVSGSAALPVSVHKQWTSLTGQSLLERYGMTEIGMALSNPYDGERRPGAVGRPLPDVDIRLKSEQGHVVTTENEPGEIHVRGPSVFLEYWNRPQATAEAFEDGWFITGDIALLDDGYYRILGRRSVDIIKSGGYKLSALEIEAVLLDHPAVRECAVVGLPDETWGEAVAAAVVLTIGRQPDGNTLKSWCHDRLSPYKVPKHIVAVDQLPRNAMGKVTKAAVRELF